MATRVNGRFYQNGHMKTPGSTFGGLRPNQPKHPAGPEPLTFRLEAGSARLWPTSSFSKRWRLLATPTGATKKSVREEPGNLTDSDLWKQNTDG